VTAFPPFTLDGYVETVGGLLSRGYEIRRFADADAKARHLILRHDIDQSIRAARIVAEREAARGWHSTWFVLMRTEMYNPWSREATSDLRAIRDLGHAVGLHLDASFYADDDALERGCVSEKAALASIVERQIDAVSLHRPPASQVGGRRLIGGKLNAYSDAFVKEMGYCSDSRGAWHHGHPWAHPAIQEGRALQLLTHPIWWVGSEKESMRDRLLHLAADRTHALRTELAANNSVWRDLADASTTILPFTLSLFEASRDGILAIAEDVPGEYWQVDHFRLDLPDKWTLSLASLDQDGAAIGYAIVSRRAARAAHLHHMMVDRAWRQKGIGAALLSEALQRASKLGLETLTLKVATDNVRAQEFYLRHGFERLRQEGPYFWMSRKLQK
jgi:ribosomal protein S18 acetylase RimI-like enzyme